MFNSFESTCKPFVVNLIPEKRRIRKAMDYMSIGHIYGVTTNRPKLDQIRNHSQLSFPFPLTKATTRENYSSPSSSADESVYSSSLRPPLWLLVVGSGISMPRFWIVVQVRVLQPLQERPFIFELVFRAPPLLEFVCPNRVDGAALQICAASLGQQGQSFLLCVHDNEIECQALQIDSRV